MRTHLDIYHAHQLDRIRSSAELAQQLTEQLAAADPRDTMARRRLETARTILGDPARRATYDQQLANPTAPLITEQVLGVLAGQPLAGQQPLTVPPGQPLLPPVGVRRQRRISKKVLAAGVGGLVVLMVIVIAAVAGTESDSASASASAKCADIVFIGAAGSGQRDAEKLAVDDGMGKFVNETYQNLLSDANDAGVSIEKRPVVYPAAPVSTLASQPQVFKSSLETGTTTATQMINEVVDQCPKSKVVAAGYSQGAMVMHRALRTIAPGSSITGVLIADGDRMPTDPNVIHKGRAADYTGISSTDLGITLSGIDSVTYFSSDWQGRLLSWCMKGDTVCSNNPGKFDFDFGAGMAIHSSGYKPNDWRPFLKQQVLG